MQAKCSAAKCSGQPVTGSAGRSRGGSGAMSRQSTEPSGFLGGFAAPTTAEPIAEGVAAASGSRALSNHILWRTAFRRDVSGKSLAICTSVVNFIYFTFFWLFFSFSTSFQVFQ